MLTYFRPKLYGKQEEAIFCAERYGLVEASTKSGKTFGCLAWLAEEALVGGKGGRSYWWCAPVYSQTLIAYRRMKRALPKGVGEAYDSRLEIDLLNGARVVFKSGDDPDNLYGEDVYAAVIDEASRFKRESWYALRTTLTATRGRVRIIGNMQGRRNWFYQLAREAESGAEGMHYAKITARDAVAAGVLVAEEVEDARRTLPEEVYQELYEVEPRDEGGSPFGYDAIRTAALPRLSQGEPVVWGWDLAKSHNWTVGYGLDREMRACRFLRFQRPWLETIADVRRETGTVPALVDSSGVGDPIVEALQRGAPNFRGYKFTARTRQQLLESLAVSLQQGKVRYLDGVTRHELEAFSFQETSMGVRYGSDAEHDDCVMALALAVWLARQRRLDRGAPAVPRSDMYYPSFTGGGLGALVGRGSNEGRF